MKPTMRTFHSCKGKHSTDCHGRLSQAIEGCHRYEPEGLDSTTIPCCGAFGMFGTKEGQGSCLTPAELGAAGQWT